MDLRALDEYARQHHGLVTREAAHDRGVSRSAWYRALRSGLLRAVHPGVARMVGSLETREQRIAAAVMAAGRGAVASHRSAALLWRIPRPGDDAVDVILPDRRRDVSLAGVVVHRPRHRLGLAAVSREGIPTTDVHRTLCDLGAVDPRSVLAAVGHVVASGSTTPAALRAAVEAHAGRGRHGVPALRHALDEWALDGSRAAPCSTRRPTGWCTTTGCPRCSCMPSSPGSGGVGMLEPRGPR